MLFLASYSKLTKLCYGVDNFRWLFGCVAFCDAACRTAPYVAVRYGAGSVVNALL